MVDRQNNKLTETQALNTANQNVFSWVRPIKSRLPYHVRAYESGMTSGNIEGACVGKLHIFWNLYHSSATLAEYEYYDQESEQMGIHILQKLLLRAVAASA